MKLFRKDIVRDRSTPRGDVSGRNTSGNQRPRAARVSPSTRGTQHSRPGGSSGATVRQSKLPLLANVARRTTNKRGFVPTSLASHIQGSMYLMCFTPHGNSVLATWNADHACSIWQECRHRHRTRTRTRNLSAKEFITTAVPWSRRYLQVWIRCGKLHNLRLANLDVRYWSWISL